MRDTHKDQITKYTWTVALSLVATAVPATTSLLELAALGSHIGLGVRMWLACVPSLTFRHNAEAVKTPLAAHKTTLIAVSLAMQYVVMVPQTHTTELLYNTGNTLNEHYCCSQHVT